MFEQERSNNAGWNLCNSYAQLPKELYTMQLPTPVKSPKVMLLNERLANVLGLNVEWLKSDYGSMELGGNKIPEKSTPLAQAYAGHQFGHFTMLGDGRAILLGEQLAPDEKLYDIQLKGSGRTPYSRGGDGRAALGPMLREYVISEAMLGLGIPTTQSLAVVVTGDLVYRENPLPGAILTRVATSHVRVGTFQYAASLESVEPLIALAEFTLQRHFSGYEEVENRYLFLLREVIKRQASLIAKWQMVGFIHGVMNTDNMALSGETIDYGPCAFMDVYDEDTVFSSIDRYGRYAYGNQPKIAAWNLARFAETLLPLLHRDSAKAVDIAQKEIAKFQDIYKGYWLAGMRAKLGLSNQEAEDEDLIRNLLGLMKRYKADYTNTFRALTIQQVTEMDLFQSVEFKCWQDNWKARLLRQADSQINAPMLMKQNNPSVIPRNHRVEEALEAADKHHDLGKVNCIIEALANPYAYTIQQEEFSTLPEPQESRYQTFCGT